MHVDMQADMQAVTRDAYPKPSLYPKQTMSTTFRRFEEVRRRDQVSVRRMPNWPAGKGAGNFVAAQGRSVLFQIARSKPSPSPSLLPSPMAMTMGARRLGASLIARFYSVAAASSSPASTAASGEIGVQDFVKSIKGVEAHADKVAQAIIGVSTLLQTRSSRLKKLGIPCKQRKMILRYTEKYRQGIWTPRMSTKQ